MRSYSLRLPLVALFAIATAPTALAATVTPRLDTMAIASAELPPGVKRSAQLDAVIADLKRGAVDQANGKWREYVGTLSRSSVDPNALVQFVLRESYLQTTEDLRFYADKVKYFNDSKKAIRQHLSELQGEAQTVRPWPRTVRVVTFRSAYSPGQRVVEASTARSLDKATLDRHIGELEQQLNAMGDDAQLANVDLQNILQKQQQTLQMMSNISKMLYDTANAVIRKVGG